VPRSGIVPASELALKLKVLSMGKKLAKNGTYRIWHKTSSFKKEPKDKGIFSEKTSKFFLKE
jgi:hypothetical protein